MTRRAAMVRGRKARTEIDAVSHGEEPNLWAFKRTTTLR